MAISTAFSLKALPPSTKPLIEGDAGTIKALRLDYADKLKHELFETVRHRLWGSGA